MAIAQSLGSSSTAVHQENTFQVALNVLSGAWLLISYTFMLLLPFSWQSSCTKSCDTVKIVWWLLFLSSYNFSKVMIKEFYNIVIQETLCWRTVLYCTVRTYIKNINGHVRHGPVHVLPYRQYRSNNTTFPESK